jgi:hypothetical protein
LLTSLPTPTIKQVLFNILWLSFFFTFGNFIYLYNLREHPYELTFNISMSSPGPLL